MGGWRIGKATRSLAKAGTKRLGTRQRGAAGLGNYDWSCFAVRQAAEKALKAVCQRMGGDAWGHSVAGLLGALPNSDAIEPELVDAAKELDKHYIPARYPNSYPEGAPFEHYTSGEAHRAVTNAE